MWPPDLTREWKLGGEQRKQVMVDYLGATMDDKGEAVAK